MAKKTVDESPMMKQFQELKEKHPDAMLLFRCGDFYETYGDDAKEAAKVLGITLTWRTPSKRHAPGDYSDAMAGFPTMHSTPICPSSSGLASAWLSATNWTHRLRQR